MRPRRIEVHVGTVVVERPPGRGDDIARALGAELGRLAAPGIEPEEAAVVTAQAAPTSPGERAGASIGRAAARAVGEVIVR